MSPTHESLELDAERQGERYLLRSPEVGRFTLALDRGAAVAPGQDAGVLVRLGVATRLVVPAGVAGRVVGDRPELVRAPVGHGDVLYEIDPAGVELGDALAAEDAAASDGAAVLRSPQSGRFYHRPSPESEPLCSVGGLLEEGTPVGLLEVMKTFSHVHYRKAAGLPARARIVRVLAADGADVDRGTPLIEVEPA